MIMPNVYCATCLGSIFLLVLSNWSYFQLLFFSPVKCLHYLDMARVLFFILIFIQTPVTQYLTCSLPWPRSIVYVRSYIDWRVKRVLKILKESPKEKNSKDNNLCTTILGYGYG